MVIFPDGHVVIFKDGNRRNFNLDNLACVSRAQLLHMNAMGYGTAPAQVKDTIMAIAKLAEKARFRPWPLKTKQGNIGATKEAIP